MPAFRDPIDGLIWTWDPESKTYVKRQKVDQPPRSHQTGGDNILFNPFHHLEKAGVPELSGYMAGVKVGQEDPESDPEPSVLEHGWVPVVVEWDLSNLSLENIPPRAVTIKLHTVVDFLSRPYGARMLADEIARQYGYPVKEIMIDREVYEDLLGYLATSDMVKRYFQDFVPGDTTFPEEWSKEGKNKEEDEEDEEEDEEERLPVPDIPASEYHSWPDRVPKRNKVKLDEDFPSMISAVNFKLASKISYQTLSQAEWEEWFVEGPAKTEIGKWLQDSYGRVFFEEGFNVNHDDIAQANNLSKSDIAALGSVYNDGTADVQIVFPGHPFDHRLVESQLQQIFPVRLVGPVGAEGAQQKGTIFEPIVIQAGQFVTPNNNPVSGVAWVKERNDGIEYQPEMILVAEHLTPEDFPIYSRGAKGIVTATGGLASHAAQLAVSSGIPVVVGIGSSYNKIETGNYLNIDPGKNQVIVLPYVQNPQEAQQLYRHLKELDKQRYPELYMRSHRNSSSEEPSLDKCPECGGQMVEKYDDSQDRLMKICYDCGHKQPIIRTRATKSPRKRPRKPTRKQAFALPLVGTLMKSALSPRNLLAVRGVKSLLNQDQAQTETVQQTGSPYPSYPSYPPYPSYPSYPPSYQSKLRKEADISEYKVKYEEPLYDESPISYDVVSYPFVVDFAQKTVYIGQKGTIHRQYRDESRGLNDQRWFYYVDENLDYKEGWPNTDRPWLHGQLIPTLSGHYIVELYGVEHTSELYPQVEEVFKKEGFPILPREGKEIDWKYLGRGDQIGWRRWTPSKGFPKKLLDLVRWE